VNSICGSFDLSVRATGGKYNEVGQGRNFAYVEDADVKSFFVEDEGGALSRPIL